MMRLFCLIILILLSHVSISQTLDVMTYNIRYDNPGDGINQWSSRKEKVYSLLKTYTPDIFGVQEALVHQLNDLKANLPEYDFVGVGRDDGKQKGEYSAIFFKKVKYSLLDQNTFWLSETPDVPGSKSWDAAITRVGTWAKFRDNESQKTFFILNTHFDHMGKEARNNSASLLKKKALELADKLPIIISGDFNCTRDEDPYKTITNSKTLILIDPAPLNPPGTFCNFGVNSQPCRAIDYVFHSEEWVSSNYSVIQDNDTKNYPSDHLPVMVTLSLKKEN